MVVSAPWWGKRNDRIGFKKNLFIALAIMGVAYAGHIVVEDLVQLGFLRAFLGFARGAILPALYSLASLYAPPERRGGIIAIASSFTLLGNTLGPTVGRFVAASFGITTSFVVNSSMLLGISIIIWKYLAEPPAKKEPRGDSEPKVETARA